MEKIVKPEYIRELGPVDVSSLKHLVSLTSDQVWDLEDSRKENKFECFHHTKHIVFRFIEGMRDHRVFYSTPPWSVWKDKLLPIMEEVSKPYGFNKPEYPKVMLARLEAGEVIDRHVDGAGSNLYVHKIHVPLQTNKKARIFIKDKPFHFEEGQAFEVNNIAPHSVENLGEEDRIHLIFEVFGDNPAG